VVSMNSKHKLKIVKPTLREKERYVKFKIISESHVNYGDLEAAIWNTFLDFYGEYEVSKLSLWLVKNLYDERSQVGIVRCNNKSVPKVVAGLGLISRFGDSRAIFKIVSISGTIRGLKDGEE
jgi:ribonuclease P/MRP protein subunit POP5